MKTKWVYLVLFPAVAVFALLYLFQGSALFKQPVTVHGPAALPSDVKNVGDSARLPAKGRVTHSADAAEHDDVNAKVGDANVQVKVVQAETVSGGVTLKEKADPAEKPESEEGKAVPKETVVRSNKTIIYSCTRGGCGGWADRQKGIVGAYVLAQMLNRTFGIHMTFPVTLDTVMTPNKVDWTVKPSDLASKNLKTYAIIDDKGAAFVKNLVATGDLVRDFTHDVILMTLNMEVVQFLRQHPLAAKVKWLVGKTVPEIYFQALGDLFTLNPDSEKQLKTFKDAKPEDTKLVCAQVRMGSHKGFQDVFVYHSLQHVRAVLFDFLKPYNDSGKFRLFVASDSLDVVEGVRRQFPGLTLSIPGPITHVDKTRGSNVGEGFRKTVVDQLALSTCHVLVISESGLGKIASFLRNTDTSLFLFTAKNTIVTHKRDDPFPSKTW